MRFTAKLPDDVIIGLDHEFYDGINDPLYVSGGDWMGFVGVQRSGGVWVAAGDDQTMSGAPSADRNWKIIDLKTYLKPDIWYLMRVEIDFSKRHYKKFSISGGGLSKTIDLSAFALDFPNPVPFNQRAVGYFFSAVRSRDMMKVAGSPIVYFDNMEGGIIKANGNQQKLFSNSFENQSQVSAQPIATENIDLKRYKQSLWYLERNDSLISIKKASFALSGKNVGVANASID